MTTHGSGLVLVADDDAVLRRLAEAAVEEAGYSVLTAADGDEALRLYCQHQQEIVCVVLDLTMPNLDGAETFRELRRINPHVPVILSSGYSEAGAVEEFAGMGPAAFLEKPYRFDALIAALHKVAGGGRAATEGEGRGSSP